MIAKSLEEKADALRKLRSLGCETSASSYWLPNCGHGGCLVIKENEISAEQGILVYLNTDGRIRDAVAKVSEDGGKVVQEILNIGPHGFRTIIIDSEGNQFALHSQTDA